MHSIWVNALKTLIILVFIVVVNTKQYALADEIPNDVNSDESNAFQLQQPEDTEVEKRAWNQLQGFLVKQSPDNDEIGESHQSYQQIRYPGNTKKLENGFPKLYDYNQLSDMDEAEGSHLAEKRAWQSMNGAWGKRDYNRFRGTGKREPGNWNNLRGLWGKRSDPRSWNKLSSAWGK